MGHSFPQASPPHYPKADDVCRFTWCISQGPLPSQQTTQTPARCVFPPCLPSPSHSNFNSTSHDVHIIAINLAYQNMWMGVPTSLEFEQIMPRQQHRQHPPSNKYPDVGVPPAICSHFLASILTSTWRWLGEMLAAIRSGGSMSLLFAYTFGIWRWYWSIGEAWLPFCFWRGDDRRWGTSLRICYGKWLGINLWSSILPCRKTQYWNFVCNISAHLRIMYSHLNLMIHSQYSSFEDYYIQFTLSWFGLHYSTQWTHKDSSSMSWRAFRGISWHSPVIFSQIRVCDRAHKMRLHQCSVTHDQASIGLNTGNISNCFFLFLQLLRHPSLLSEC